ncbi:MAG: hypothetical protein HC871_01430, partial [Rhizobiales bacterium]|nr:hypothetical protein [Hyphomicrobiales bacterium]
MSRSRIAIAAAILIAATVTGCDQPAPPAPQARPVRTVTVERGAEGETGEENEPPVDLDGRQVVDAFAGEHAPGDVGGLDIGAAVTFKGVLPDLFREGQGVVAQVRCGPTGVFAATEILAKHDETYMPPEVAEALKKSGRWREG